MNLLSRLLVVLFIFTGICAVGQTRYNMANQSVNECEGILVDSEAGKDPGIPNGYALNEDYCFTICVPNSPKITITFTQFELETPCTTCDYIEIFDGPNCTGTKLGKWGGTSLPGSVTGSTSCISIHFVSDGNVAGKGFELNWNATPPPPIPPVIQPIANVNCKSNSVTITFDKPVPCGQLVPGKFVFSGPAGASIASVTPVNCVNGFATSAILTFNKPLDQSGTYSIDYTVDYVDICLKSYRFVLHQTFNIINCPLTVRITGDSIVCLGFCVDLTADVQGGNPANYQYSWTPINQTTKTVNVCPTVTTTYQVTVTDGASQPASATKTVTVLSLPNAGNDTAMCLFGPPVNFTGTPAGGNWQGPGITNGNNGTFNPPSANYGTKTVTYYGPNGCPDTKQVEVWPVWAGGNQSACLGSNPFQLNGFPAGGTFTGQNVTAGGTFTPSPVGTYNVTYTESAHGCVSTAVITVVNNIQIPPPGTITACSVTPAFNMSSKGTVAPANGVWSGTGITNGGNGTFNPGQAGVGHHTLTYSINGCSDTTNVVVTVIDAGADVLICPNDTSKLIVGGNPSKGFWTGPGVVDNGDTTFNFNPALISQDSIFTITYSKDGCSDQRIIYLLHTTVSDTTIEFCPYDGKVLLDPAVTKPNIQTGVWTGAGLTANKDSIDPKLLSPGLNYLYYEVQANGCIDSLRLLVKPKPLAQLDTTVCPQSSDFNVSALPGGGSWSGTGITNTTAGTFSPVTAGQGFEGIFDLVYDLNGCTDTMSVILKKITPNFNGLVPIYCLKPVSVTLNPTPAGGTFSGKGITGYSWDPAKAGPGIDTIIYTYGTGSCTAYDTVTVLVRNPIDFNFVYNNQKLCYGDSVLVNTLVTGGDSTYKYTWTPNKSSNGQIYITPTTFTTFTLTVDDQCSVPVTKSATIDVWPEILYNVSVGPAVCFGDLNWAKIDVTTPPKSDYAYKWNTEAGHTSDSINVVAAKYKVDVTNIQSNCSITVPVSIPYYPLVKADFLKTPIENCISVVDPHFEFINLSTGANQGYWDFGDSAGVTTPYDPQLNPGHTYADTGKYHVKLFIRNTFGCSDSIETDLCIYPVKKDDMPNAFTPNGDGNNDFFPSGGYSNGKYVPIGYGITDYEMKIFDRWGHMVYETDASRTPWNGKLMNTGDLLRNGVYVYEMNVYFGPRDIRQLSGHVTLIR